MKDHRIRPSLCGCVSKLRPASALIINVLKDDRVSVQGVRIVGGLAAVHINRYDEPKGTVDA